MVVQLMAEYTQRTSAGLLARIRNLGAVLLAAALALLVTTSAQGAGLSPEVQKGLTWLQAQVQTDGSLVSEQSSIATPLQARSEAAVTLAQLAALPPQLASLIAADSDQTIEALARRAIAAGANASDGSALIATLLTLQNDDGGFGGDAGYQSNALDTALALIALDAQRAYGTSADSVSRALAYLAQSRTTGGGWGVQEQARRYVTALVLLAGQRWNAAYSVGSITLPARDWLLTARTGAVYGNALDDALGLLALTTQTTDAATLQPLAAALLAAQGADGSWAGDPFVTALALRALWASDNVPPPSTTGGLAGTVASAATGAAIEGAALQLLELPDAAVQSAADGSFALSGIAPGSYTLRVSKVGFEAVTASLQITVGQIVNVGEIRLTPATLTATVVGTVKNQSGTALAGAIVAVGTASALTDAKGQYVLSGIPPGTASITATLSGYTQAVSAPVAFEAGKTYGFSPTLYTGTPPATVLRGKVVDAASAAAIAGATVSFGAQSVVTPASGNFSFSAAAGPFSVTVSAAGYGGVTATGVLVDGVNDLGNLPLAKLAATSTVSGKVTDSQTGEAIAGATITLQGLTATTAADGTYSLSGITSTTFDLTATGAGYLALTQHVSLTQPGAATINVSLTKLQASGIAIDAVTPGKAHYLPTEMLGIDVLVRNTTAQATDVVIDALVLDGQGNVALELKANAHGLGNNPPNLALTIPAGGTTTVTMSQLLLRRDAGAYTVLVRAYDASGRAIAEGQGSFSVDALAVLSGGVIIDPPLTQAGAQTPVRFTGQIGNSGNQPIPGGDLTLTVTLENAEPQGGTQPQTTARTLASGAPFFYLRGLASDASGNLYTVNSGYNDGRVFRVAPDGATTLAVQIPINSPNYPSLSGVARDAAGNLWVANATGGTVWKVDNQGAITKLMVAALDTISGIDIDAQGNLLLTGKKGPEHRLARRDPAGAEAVLWANGLSSPLAMIRDAAGDLIVTNNGDNTLVKVRSTGEILPFVTGLNRPMGITRDSAGNLYVANNGDSTIIKVTPAGATTVYATGLNQPVDLRFDASGNLFVSCQGDSAIRKVAADGSVALFARGIANRPGTMRYDAAGNLYIANDDGTLRRLDAAGSAAELATGLATPRGMAFDATGAVLVTNYANGTIARIDGAGKTTLASGLSNPWGIAVGASGDLVVTEYGKNRLSRLDASGALVERIDSLLYYPGAVVIDGAGNRIVRNNNSLTILGSGGARVFFAGFGPSALTPDPAGNAVFVTYGYDVYRIAYDGTSVKLKSLPFSPYGIAADGAGNLVIGDYSGRKIYRMDGAGNLTVLATTAAYPRFVVSDAVGKVYMLATDNVVYSVAADGTLTSLSVFYKTPSWDYPSGLGMAVDGRPLVWTNTARVIAVDPATGTQTTLKSGINPNGAAVDGSGQLHATYYSDHDLISYDATGVEVARVSGFSAPGDLVWDGSKFWFVDSGRMFALAAAAGSYPVKQGNGTVNALAVGPSGAVMGASGGNLYRWDATKFTSVATVAGSTALAAVAVRGDGAVSVADSGASRVTTLSSSYAILADYAGLAAPMGLAVDAGGRLLVASNTLGTIARFEANAAANSVPTLFARVATAGWLNFDASGQLWVTSGSTVRRVDASGVVTQVSTTPTLAGIVVDAAAPMAVGTGSNQIYRWDGTAWTSFAAGLSAPQGLRALPDGGIAVASTGNGTLVKWLAGTLDILAAGLVNPRDVAVSADGQQLFVAGDQGSISRIAADGGVTGLGVGSLIGNTPLYGIAARADGRLAATGYVSGTGSIYEVSIIQPTLPPAVGTIVYQTTRAVAALPAGEAITAVDFGNWVPPYGGDFKATISRSGLTGEVYNFLHAGPFAQGSVAVANPTVAPGTQTVPVQVKITGADFSSVSRVETALIKPTVMGVRPNGMVADRAGNIYATDGSTLRKTTPAGVESVLLSGYTFGNGMAIDSNERLYVPVYVSGVYRLLSVTLDGQATVLVANLGATPAGVAVNSHEEIFVGMPGRLLKVAQDGSTSTFATAGIPAPVGVSIDGKDNIYILNSGNLVTQIKADGSALVLYNKGDGVDHPSFEYEGMAMTADCGENLYLAPIQWNKVGQSGEEYTLVQILARTGQAVPVLDGRKIHYDLTDMDYIAFDRFGSRILIWTDYSGGRIWQVPVTCGAIGVEAHLVTKPGQTFTGMNRPAAAVVPLANGGTEYVWSLRDVTAAGVTFGFDTLLRDLVLGEMRPVMDSGFLLFKNSFSPTDVKVPLDIPSVQVGNLVDMGITTDQASYPANTTAMVATRLNNANASEVAGMLTVDVFDAAGVRVGGVTQQAVTLPAGAVVDVPGSFPVGSIVPGTYVAKATLADNGLTLAQASAAFEVVGDNVTGSATSQLMLDKGSYQPSDRVTITSRALSKSANVVMENLSLLVTVSDPAGTVLHTVTIAVAQLPAGATLEYVNQYAFTAAAAGTYTVTQTLTDSAGTVLDVQTRTYDVVSSAVTGFGLTASLSASPREVPIGQAVSVNFMVSNTGNGPLAALPAQVRILDPVAGTVVAQLPLTLDLPAGATQAANQSWIAQGKAGDTLIVVLVATVGGTELTLAQDTIVLKTVSVELTLGQALERASRVLVLAACSGHGEGNEEDHDDHGHDHSHDRSVVSRPNQSSHASCDHNGDGHDDSGDDGANHGRKCGLGRAQTIDGLLTGLGIAHRVTTDPEIFRTELRTGAYSTYWVSGQVSKLRDDLAEEIREAVYRGEGLILDGVHDQRNKVLEETAGATAHGKQGSRNVIVWALPPLFDGVALGSVGHSLRLDLAGGQITGRYRTQAGLPAIVANAYGQGRSVLFGIDLVASLTADPTRWPGETGSALGWLLPPLSGSFGAGAYVPLTLTVKNLGEAAQVEVHATLPAGAVFVSADPTPTAVPTAGVVSWSFSMAANAEQVVHLALRAPAAAGSYGVVTEIGTVANGAFTAYGQAQTLSFTVAAAGSQLTAVQSQIKALTVTSRDRNHRDTAAARVGSARTAMAGNRWADAISQLIDAIDQLKDITSADTSAIRLSLDQALREAEWQWVLHPTH